MTTSSEVRVAPIGVGRDALGRLTGRTLPMLVTGLVVVALSGLAAALYLAPGLAAPALAVVGLGLPVLWLVWWRPEFGLLGVIFLTSGFIPANAIDVRLPVGGLDARDLVFLGLSGLVVVRGLLRHDLAVGWRWVGGTLVVLWGVAGLSAIYGLLFRGVTPNWVLSELRPILYYATFVAAALGLRQQRQLVALLIGLFVLADLTATTIILQQFLGTDNHLLAAMTVGGWNVWQADSTYSGFGAVRVIPPGHVLTYFVSTIAVCLLLADRRGALWRWALIAQVTFLAFALLFTYSRAQWLASAIALALVVILQPLRGKVRLARYGLGIVLGLLLVYSLVGEALQAEAAKWPFVSTVTARASTFLVPDETIESDSLRWRLFETEQSWRSIAQHPLLGVGLGNVYRNPTTLYPEVSNGIRSGYRLTRYVHNSYLYLTVKMGIPALLALGLFILALLVSSWQRYSRERVAPLKLVALGSLASFAGLFVWAFSQSHLLQTETTAVVGLFAGTLASMGGLAGAPGPEQGDKARLPAEAT